MIPAGFLSVIPAAASSSRNRAAGSADKVTFSAIPIRSWTGREVERAGASDDVMGLLRFGWEKESLLVQSVCGGGGLAHIETCNPVGLASTAAARPGSDRTHSTTIRRYPGILGTPSGRVRDHGGRLGHRKRTYRACWHRPVGTARRFPS